MRSSCQGIGYSPSIPMSSMHTGDAIPADPVQIFIFLLS